MAIDYTRPDREPRRESVPHPSDPSVAVSDGAAARTTQTAGAGPVDTKIDYSHPRRRPERQATDPPPTTSKPSPAAETPSDPRPTHHQSRSQAPTASSARSQRGGQGSSRADPVPPPPTKNSGGQTAAFTALGPFVPVGESAGPVASSTLTEVGRRGDGYCRDVSSFIDSVKTQSAHAVASAVAQLPDIAPMLEAMASARNNLAAAMAARYPGKPLNAGSDTSRHTPAQVWVAAAHTLFGDLQTTRLPLTSGGKQRDFQEFRTRWEVLENEYAGVVKDLRTQAYNDAKQYLRNIDGRALPAVPPPPPLPFPAGFSDHRTLAAAVHHLVPGAGPLWFSLAGTVTAADAMVKLDGADTSTDSYRNNRGAGKPERQVIAVGTSSADAVLDLDVAGGFRTENVEIAEAVILQALAALPPDQMAIRVFDPEHLGDSASFLYGLGDAAPRIIGDKVKTTDRELEELLHETEGHITMVTQKYLQGDFKTLTEYNRAAKMNTEPYRVLLLFNYPSGFKRSNQIDDERVKMLHKIVAGGPRAGVFTILVGPDLGYGHESDETGESWNQHSSPDQLLSPLFSLPAFCRDQHVGPVGHRALVGFGDHALTFARVDGHLPQSAMVGSDNWNAQPSAKELEMRWKFTLHPTYVKLVSELLLPAIQRNYNKGAGTVIRPGWIAGLAAQEAIRRRELGSGPGDIAARPYDPSTWWRGNAAEGVSAHVGQLGASGVADLNLHSDDGGVGALIGGRPGSGKSILMHALIMSLVLEYSPKELELYLIDFKEGVEFVRYAANRLPHARAIAIEAEREFGIAVLEGMADEISRRGDLFRPIGETKLDGYRRATGQGLTRQVVVIDEFQKLFEKDDTLAQRASGLLERILREGRAFGLHVVLASQTTAGMQGLDKHVLNLIPTRVALRSGDRDSEAILGEGNSGATDLNRAGEGIINVKQGNPDANERFQTTLWNDEDQLTALTMLRSKADAEGIDRQPAVFDGQHRADVTELAPEYLANLSPTSLPLGLPVSLAGPQTLDLKREGGANLLVVDNSGPGSLIAALSGALRAGTRIEFLDFMAPDDEWKRVREVLETASGVKFSSRRDLADVLESTATMVADRVEFEEYGNPAHLLVIVGLHRARDFDGEAYGDEGPVGLLRKIAFDGPEVGVHVIAWIDRATMVERRLSQAALREFGLRFVGPCSVDDSRTLIDSDQAATLKANQMMFDDHEHAVSNRVRSYGLPDLDWLRSSIAASSGQQ